MKTKNNAAYSRQSFLGPRTQEFIERCVVGIAGLGGGGSHVAQQLAHLGFLNYVLFDRDTMEESNLNRLVGGTMADVLASTPKVEIARRTILGIRPKANVGIHQNVWQVQANELKSCDIIFGCVDGFDQRRQLEAMARRYLIPLIDVGMDVHQVENEHPSISGQVILSMPGHACMTCLGFLDEKSLTREAAAYGAAGTHPQVVWSNGILASAAVGLAVDLITDWSRALRGPAYLAYRGNFGTLEPHPLLRHAPRQCDHFKAENSGEPLFRPL